MLRLYHYDCATHNDAWIVTVFDVVAIKYVTSYGMNVEIVIVTIIILLPLCRDYSDIYARASLSLSPRSRLTVLSEVQGYILLSFGP